MKGVVREPQAANQFCLRTDDNRGQSTEVLLNVGKFLVGNPGKYKWVASLPFTVAEINVENI